jgi:hypothetical protein
LGAAVDVGAATAEREGWMSSKKARQTFAKLRREQAVRERRVKKMERKEAARSARAAEHEPAQEASSTVLEDASADGAITSAS